MIKRNLRISALLLLFSLTAGVAVSCASVKRPGGQVELSEVPIYNYTIVRGDDSGNLVLKQVLTLKNAIESRCSGAPSVSTDWNVLVGEVCTPMCDIPEILVGITNRPESEAVNAELNGKHGYVCRAVGNKIVITASTGALLEQAVSYFIDECLESAQDGYLPAKIDKTYFEKTTLYYSETDSAKPVLYIPENAAFLLEETARCFSERASASSEITVSHDRAPLPEHTAVFTLSGEMLPAAEHYTGDGWLLNADLSSGSLILQAESDDALIYALSDLSVYFEEHHTEMLTGGKRLYYAFTHAFGEAELPVIPAVFGGTFTDGESVSSLCDVYHFEGVSVKDYTEYQEHLVCCYGYTRLYTNSNPCFRHYSEAVELQLLYDSDRQILSVLAIDTNKESASAAPSADNA